MHWDDKLSLKRAWSRSRDVFEFWEISNNISVMVQVKRHSYNGRLTGNHVCPKEWHDCQWPCPWVSLKITFAVLSLCKFCVQCDGSAALHVSRMEIRRILCIYKADPQPSMTLWCRSAAPNVCVLQICSCACPCDADPQNTLHLWADPQLSMTIMEIFVRCSIRYSDPYDVKALQFMYM